MRATQRTAIGPGGSTEFGPPGGTPGGGAGERSLAAASPNAQAALEGTGAAAGTNRSSAASLSAGGSAESAAHGASPASGRGASDQALGAAGQRTVQGPSGLGQPAANGPAGLLPGQWQEKPPGATAAEAERTAQAGQADRNAPSARSRNRPDWALPEAGPKSTGIVRPIHVELHADRMIVGLGADAKTIALPARTAAVTDELVTALWAQMESWGIAGKSAHWRPVLAVDVAPGADGRYADLARMLEGSGVSVERRAAARSEGNSLR